MKDQSALRDAVTTALAMARELGRDRMGLVGYGTAVLYAPDGELLLARPFANLITTVGDAYYATRGIGTSTGAGTPVTGMQIGSGGGTAASKSSTGAGMVTLLGGKAFDSAPTAAAKGGDTGWEITHVTTFQAGLGTGAVTEAVITNITPVTTTSPAANSISRVTFTVINKAAGDSLAITWKHVMLGS